MQIMESWLFGGSERVSFEISDGVFPPFASTSMTKEALSEWGMGISCNHNNLISHTSRQGFIENPTFLDSSVCAAHDSIPEGLERGFIEHRSKEHDIILGSSVLMKADESEKEEGSKTSSSVVDPDAQYSSLIDLKLGRLSEWRDSENSKSSKIMGNFLTEESVNTAKRTQSAGTNGKAPLCQVHGCNMDLRSFKDYYKRHKVCQFHSKTAKVIVNGIQQRFCQQCSRFHLLSEFDDGKRSCRKRLAGHNARRRKPLIAFQSGNSGMVLPYYGSNFLGTPLSDGILHNGNCESIDWSRLAGLNTSTSMQMQTSTFHMRTDLAVPRDMEKEISFSNGNATVPGSKFSVYASQYGSGISASDSIFDAGDSVKDFTGVTDSNRARSLLSSSQQANLCVYPSTIPVTPLSSLHKNDASECKLRIPDRAELALQGSSNTTLSFGVDTPGYSQATFMQNEIKSFGDLESQMWKNFHGSPHFGGTGSVISHEHGQTTDLLRPSPLPQGAESHKRSLQVKQPFGSLPIS